MMKALGAAALAIVLLMGAVPCLADVAIFNDGRAEEVQVVNVTEQAITVKSPYGDIEYPRSAVYFLCKSTPERPGEEYLAAGLFMLRIHNKGRAERLFARAIALNEQYKPLVNGILNDYNRPPSERPPEQKVRIVIPCTFCSGTAKVQYTPITGESSSETSTGSSDDTEDNEPPTIVDATCPACAGRGYRFVEVGPSDGLCTKCGGCGCVQGTAKETSILSQPRTESGGEHGTTTTSTTTTHEGPSLGPPYSKCRDCGGFGVLAVSRGGDRGAIEKLLASAGQGPQRDEQGDAEEDEDEVKVDEVKVKDTSSDDDQSFMGKYRTYLFVGGGALLLVAIVASQMSKKK